MKLNWAERWVVNNPSRVFQQRLEIGWLQQRMPLASEAAVLEVGCGRGAGADLILKKFQLKRIHAMDLDLNMIRRAEIPSSRSKATGLCLCRRSDSPAPPERVLRCGFWLRRPASRAGLAARPGNCLAIRHWPIEPHPILALCGLAQGHSHCRPSLCPGGCATPVGVPISTRSRSSAP